MKIKSFLLVLCMLLVASTSFAAWTVDVSLADVKGHYVYYKIHCVSDGDASGNIDIVALMNTQEKSYVSKGVTMLILDTDPGTGGTAPDDVIDFSVLNVAGLTTFGTTALSNVADTVGTSMAEDYHQYPVMTTKTYISVSDIGAAADVVDFYIFGWVE